MFEVHESQGTIPPEIYTLYEWDLTQDDTTVTVKLNYPEDFQSQSLEISYSSVENAIFVAANCSDVPIICGTLYGGVQEFKFTKSSEFTTIFITKKEKKHWKLLIKDKNPENDKIDPKSSMNIWMNLSSQEQQRQDSLKWFQIALQAYYLPAIRYYINELESSDINNVTYQLILHFYQVAIDQYDDAISCLNYGQFLIKSNVTEDTVFDVIDMAAQRGLKTAGLQGKLLSRYSNIKFDSKKDISAVKYLLKGIEENPNDFELYHLLALHYSNGCGVKKDIREANRYQEQAKKINKNVKDLPHEPSSFSAIITATAVMAIGGFAIYKFLKKRK